MDASSSRHLRLEHKDLISSTPKLHVGAFGPNVGIIYELKSTRVFFFM